MQFLGLVRVALQRPALQPVDAARQQPTPIRRKLHALDQVSGNERQLTAGRQLPQTQAIVHAEREEAAIGTNVPFAVSSLSGAQAADDCAIFATGNRFEQLELPISAPPDAEPATVTAERR